MRFNDDDGQCIYLSLFVLKYTGRAVQPKSRKKIRIIPTEPTYNRYHAEETDKLGDVGEDVAGVSLSLSSANH